VTVVSLVAMMVLLLVAIVLSAFFSGAEMGAYVVNRVRLRLRAQAGHEDARRLRRLLDDPRGLLTTILVGNNLANFGATTLVARLMEGRVADPALLTTLLLAPFLFIFGEVVPKNLFRRYPDAFLYPASRPLHLAKVVLAPLAHLARGLSGAWPIGAPRRPTPDALTRERVRSLLLLGGEEGLLTAYQQDVAANILRLSSVTIDRACIPMDKVVALRDPVTPEAVLAALAASHHPTRPVQHPTPTTHHPTPAWGHARYPIIASDGTVRDLLEVTPYLLHLRSAVSHLPSEISDLQSQTARRPMLRLPASTTVPKALDALQDARDPMGLVVDPADRPIGIVTIKDLVEEIVGELGEW
jgi:putative hemolysin